MFTQFNHVGNPAGISLRDLFQWILSFLTRKKLDSLKIQVNITTEHNGTINKEEIITECYFM